MQMSHCGAQFCVLSSRNFVFPLLLAVAFGSVIESFCVWVWYRMASQSWGSVSAPGIFFDPCPTGDHLGGALRGHT